MTLKINELDPKMERMAKDWPRITALLGGTIAMREAEETYLPKQPKEDKEDYDYRLATSTLFNAYERTCGVMAGKPFSKELTLNDVPGAVEALMADVDGQGRSIHAFASDIFETSAIEYGFGGILVDFTTTVTEEDGRPKAAMSRAQEKAIGARPIWSHIKHDQVLGYRAKNEGGNMRLTMLRLSETLEEEDEEGYGSTVYNCVRVFYPEKWELWVQRNRSGITSFQIEKDGINTLGAIPFVPIYGRRLGFMYGVAPMAGLADLNIKHWQHQSDQDDSARFARKRLLVFSGIDNKDDVTVASNYAMTLPNGAAAEVIQGSAESVTVGRNELDALEDQMIQVGAEILVATPGQRTATEASNDAEANKSMLQSIVENFEDAMDQALQFTADWLKASNGGTVSLFKDFAANSLSDASAQMVITMANSAFITKRTALVEMQRRGILSPDLDPDVEVAGADAEAPDLGGGGGA